MEQYDAAQKLPASDIVEAGYVESMPDNLSSGDKLFWLRGIFTEVLRGNRVVAYQRVVARMIAAAWYPVVYFRLSLGYSDKLADAVRYLHEELKLPREPKEERLVEVICGSTDAKLTKMISDFANLVPFRLIRPFYQREIEYEKKIDAHFHDGKVNALIERCNRADQSGALYVMDRLNGILSVSAKWADYLTRNAPVIQGWLNYKLIKYIQERNPNVPAIPFKLFPPQAGDRNLARAAAYWKAVQAGTPLFDLYTGKEFTEENYRIYGRFSVDHFIPWSFVLHNEIWNLYPMFQQLNSKKNNKLPDRNRYLEQFCDNQYRAFLRARQLPRLKKTTDEYMTVRKDVYDIGESDRGHDAFVNSLRQTIEPLYQIANNQGYGVWWHE